ncbi:ABC transporter permease subunit [Pseudarthrobacter sp. AG30]|uniref:ABC transporter permease n=1 Tax=Pseudarthrobacter sp. AG30 TaxID=2249742 RepID=UPI000D6DE7D0|nr:ABC transporter permease [Pseudarthrobacter sp. AG30]RAX14744.1 ABC transporter permease subunit [Pseudarthrobacter sp. AG30]
MLRYIVRRLTSGVVLLVAITILGFTLLYLGGGDIARKILGESADTATVEAKAQELGLNQPLYVQFTSWATRALGGDLGTSWFSGQHVAEAITSRVAVTLSLVTGAIVLIAIVSVFLGVLAATRRGWIDRFAQLLAVVGHAIPGFLIAVGLVLVFALTLHWFDPTGYVAFTDDPAGWAKTVVLPVIALAFGGIANVTQQIRGSVIDALRHDYVRTLRSRGLPARRVILKHVLRNAAGPALAVLGVHFVALLGVAVVVEQVFAIPGLGQIAVQATALGDIPLVMGLLVAITVIVIIFNLIVDLAQGWLNPKVRLS